MKTLKMITVLAFTSLASVAQDLRPEQVPAKIITEFQKHYPKVTNTEWEMKAPYYEVEFDIGKYDHEISFDSNGKIMKEKMDIAPSKLPKLLVDMIKSKYPTYKIDDVELTRFDGKTSYKVEIAKGWLTERKLIFDHTGKLISDLVD